jgi:hypothetical protein
MVVMVVVSVGEDMEWDTGWGDWVQGGALV